MAIFGQKPWVKTFAKMSIFELFKIFLSIAQKGVFSFQNIVKHIFLACIAQKKKFGKWPFLDKNHGLRPLQKCQFQNFLNLLFSQPTKAFFVLEYRTRHFPGLYCLNKKVGKMAIFGPKPWVNQFAKMSIFKLFKLVVFIAQKGVLSFQNIVEDIFLACIA